MRIQAREFLLIPNILSLVRLLLIPIVVFLVVRGQNTAALLLILFAMVTDILDGYLARKLNQVSELGKIIDPLGDKLGTAALVVTLALYRDFPVWAAIFVIARDVALLFGAAFYIALGQPTPMSNMLGRLTALAWGIAVVSYLTPWHWLHLTFLYIAVAMVPLSFIFYLRRTFHRT
jgi:CDP-diacylglycerol--glycerol-3-phosphate 3-phosphatidyltransferase